VSIVNSVATITSLAAIWKTVFDIDLAALPTSWSNADGVYAMGGYNWTKYGTAKQAGAGGLDLFGVENGVGLRMQPDTGGIPDTSSITNRPYLTLQLSPIIPSFTRYTPVRLSWISIPGGNAANDVTHYAGLSIQENAVPYRICWSQLQLMRQNPAIAATYTCTGYNPVSGSSPAVSGGISVEYLTRRIARTTLPQGFANTTAIHELAAGVVWPNESDWLWTGTIQSMNPAYGPSAAPLSGLLTNMFIEIGSGSNGNNNPGPWVSKIKLEAMY
jgi:hypothetical protein